MIVTERLVTFYCLLGAVMLGSSVSLAAEGAKPKSGPAKVSVYIGTYTRGDSKGIYLSQLDLATGKLSSPKLAGEAKNPSFLALHPGGKFLYSVSEVDEYEGSKGGAVTAFSIDPEDGSLTFLNHQSSGGAGPCHLVVDAKGRHVLVANYGGGSVSAVRIRKNGKLAKSTAFVQHEGSSVDPRRQAGPHAHSINLDPANGFAFAADLGLDKVLVYQFDSKKGTLTANATPFAKVEPGAGPRHFAFHPTGRFAYVINEIHLTVTAFAYEAGTLTTLQTITTLPEVENRKGLSTAEVQVHPSGKFLYGSNRGHDTIAIFSIDEKTGKLTANGHQSILGKTPRNFGIDPTGQFLLACGQSSNDIHVFRIDQKTGKLTPTGHSISVSSPVCVKMLPVSN